MDDFGLDYVPIFTSKEEYLKWCERMVVAIYYANILCNNEGIVHVVEEIATKLHCSEQEKLY